MARTLGLRAGKRTRSASQSSAVFARWMQRKHVKREANVMQARYYSLKRVIMIIIRCNDDWQKKKGEEKNM
jgi:hypothetical protein